MTPIDRLPRVGLLCLNHDTELGWLIAMPFGEVSDEALADEIAVGEAFRYIARPGDGGIVGFVVRQFATFDPKAPEVGRIWRGTSARTRRSRR